jgi:hypothetical protein
MGIAIKIHGGQLWNIWKVDLNRTHQGSIDQLVDLPCSIQLLAIKVEWKLED